MVLLRLCQFYNRTKFCFQIRNLQRLRNESTPRGARYIPANRWQTALVFGAARQQRSHRAVTNDKENLTKILVEIKSRFSSWTLKRKYWRIFATRVFSFLNGRWMSELEQLVYTFSYPRTPVELLVDAGVGALKAK